jgi:ATP-dependent protease ClpP protease subunit
MMSEIYKPGRKQQWYNLAVNEDASEASAYLYDDIGGYGITAKDFIEEVNYLKAKNLNVRINSYGGEIDQGVAIYNFLKDYDGEVNVYVDGIAASIASVIAMAGDKVIMGEAALMFIHNPWTMAAGDAASFQKEAANLQKRKAALMAIYTAKTGIASEIISQLMDEETLLNAKEAVEMGFANSIDEIEQPEMAFNSSMYNKIVSAMARKLKTEENKMDEKPVNQEPVEEEVAEVAPDTKTNEVDTEADNNVCPNCGKELAMEYEEEKMEEDETYKSEETEEEVPNARAEFNQFVDAFGMERAAEYFAAGLSLVDAKAAYMDALIVENKDLKAKLSAVETVKPVASKVDDASDAPISFTRLQISKMSKEEYARNKQEILKAYAEGRIK